MKAELSFQFDSLEELHDFTAKIAVPVPPAMPVLSPALTHTIGAEEPRATKVRKTAKSGTSATAPDVPAASAVEDGTGAVSQEEVRAAITAVNDKFGLVPARKVLTQFGVKRIPELKPEQYADFVKACNAVK